MGGIGWGKCFSFTMNPCFKYFFRRGGGGGGARVSDFFNKEPKSEKIKYTYVFLRAVGVGGGGVMWGRWLK